MTKHGLNLANRITLLRMLLNLPFIIAILQQKFAAALLLGVVLGLSDFFDGLIARRLRQQTKLGSFLDPLADKLLLVSTFASLTYIGAVPAWLFAVLLSKDATVSMGWFLFFVVRRTTRVQVRFSGKAATASQMVFAGIVLLSLTAGPHLPIATMAVPLFQYLTVALTLISLLDYLWLGSQRLLTPPHRRSP